MADGNFKSMTPDPSSQRASGPGWKCERCGGMVRPGGWPWCKGKPENHDRS